MSNTSFPPQITDINGSKAKIQRALDIALKKQVDVICLPELCLCKDWIHEIKKSLAKRNVVVIAGSYYDTDKHNVCEVLMDLSKNIPPQMKITPSPFEEPGIINKKMVSGDKLYIYETGIGKFSILICRDFINLRHLLRGKTDIIFVPSYNDKIERFQKDAINHITNSHGYVVISNASIFGGTSVFGKIRTEFNNELVEEGYKDESDDLYKLCELKKEKKDL